MKVMPYKKNSDFVCFIEGIDISKNISSSNVNKIDKLINKYAVVVFRNQLLTDQQQNKVYRIIWKNRKTRKQFFCTKKQR